MVTSQQILSAKKCGDIFSSDCKQDVIAEYREIARVYHPDISTDPKANEVMAKVNQLYEEALRLIDAGTWEVSNQIILKDKSGKKYVGRYLKQVPFELGEAYIANSSVTYLFAQKNKKFFDNAMEQIKGLRYANRKMEDEISRFMPQILYALSLEDGRYCIVLKKPEDVFLLSYGIPEECCPICQFIEYSNKDLAKYLEREYKVSRDEVFAKVKQLNKRRKKLYDSEYVTEVCSRFHLNPAEIVAGLKDRFGTYSRFYDFIHKG
jgi:hypothetical protein